VGAVHQEDQRALAALVTILFKIRPAISTRSKTYKSAGEPRAIRAAARGGPRAARAAGSATRRWTNGTGISPWMPCSVSRQKSKIASVRMRRCSRIRFRRSRGQLSRPRCALGAGETGGWHNFAAELNTYREAEGHVASSKLRSRRRRRRGGSAAFRRTAAEFEKRGDEAEWMQSRRSTTSGICS